MLSTLRSMLARDGHGWWISANPRIHGSTADSLCMNVSMICKLSILIVYESGYLQFLTIYVGLFPKLKKKSTAFAKLSNAKTSYKLVADINLHAVGTSNLIFLSQYLLNPNRFFSMITSILTSI